MERFHEISTEDFKPISYKNRYLYDDYERVSNFLAGFLDKNKSYKFILAKPVKNENYRVDWFSPYSDLQDVRQNKNLEQNAYEQYFEFLELVNTKIKELEKSTKPDSQNWAGILSEIFRKEENLVFSNGKEISIIWGWQFNNNEIYKPDIRVTSTPQDEEEEGTKNSGENPIEVVGEPKKTSIKEDGMNKTEDEGNEFEDEGTEPLIEHDSHNKTLEFLKWFASKYWWILILLLILIALVFTVKALKHSY